MVWSPSGSMLVEILAWPLETAATPLLGAPTKGEPFSSKVTVPMLGVGELETVAVKVTDCPKAAKVGFEVTVVVVECPVEGVMSMHQPPAAVVVVGPDSFEMYSDHAPCAVAPTNDVRKLLLPAGAAVEKVPRQLRSR